MSKWEMVKLGDICDVRDGTHDSPKYIEKGYPLITSKNVANGTINFCNVNYISQADYIKINKRSFVDDGDILMPMIGTIGNPIIVNKTREFAIKNVALIKFNNSNILNRYVNYYLKSDKFKKYINKENRGGTQKFLSLSNIRDFVVPLQPLDAQKHIADTLDKAQEIIDGHKKQLEELDNLIKAIFYDMFGDPRLNNKNWKDDKLGDRLGVLTDYHSNGSYESLRDNVQLLDTSDYALMVRTTDLEKNNFVDDVKYISRHAYEHLEKSKVFGGEIIINKIGSAGKVYLMPCLNRPVSLAMNQFLLRFDEKVNHIYAYYYLTTDYSTANIKDKVRGAVTKTITKDAVRDILLLTPSIDLQNKFATIVANIEEQKAIVRKSIEESQNLFNSLMSKYFD